MNITFNSMSSPFTVPLDTRAEMPAVPLSRHGNHLTRLSAVTGHFVSEDWDSWTLRGELQGLQEPALRSL